ncbi:MAG: phosphate/phosphite/phosphonate ABC transporter substrate-binding protein [Nitrospiraceae bacterium]|nr:phosphate/phosphite/phosphonate ABC transporter substrate-binding protein [Nitrospiraceae bacterium]
MARKVVLAIMLVLSAASFARAQEKARLLIGLVPEENIFRMIEKHLPLADYIEKRTGIKIQFTILSRYGDIIDRFTTRNMDGAFFGAFTGLLANRKLGVQPLVRPVGPDGLVSAQSIVFVRKDSGIRTFAQMRGKRAVFVDKATATGFIYLLYRLKQIGVTDYSRFFRQYYFTGNHEESIYAVLDGRADVGVVKSRFFDKLSLRDPLISERLLVLAKSNKLPDIILCLRSDIPAAIRNELKRTLINMKNDPEGARVLRTLGYSGFEEAKPADFAPAAELTREAGINIMTYQYTR